MSLVNDDLKKIKNLIDAGNEYLDSREEKRVQSLETYMSRRFKNTEDRLERVERKIDQLLKTEEEDILVAYKEIEVLKKRLTRVEIKLKLATK